MLVAIELKQTNCSSKVQLFPTGRWKTFLASAGVGGGGDGEDRAVPSLTEFPGREFLVEELETGMPTSEVSGDTAKG